jgi:hypothetical protein
MQARKQFMDNIANEPTDQKMIPDLKKEFEAKTEAKMITKHGEKWRYSEGPKTHRISP